MRPLGCHISGGAQIGTHLKAAVDNGFTAAQVFLGQPTSPRLSQPSPEEARLFLDTKANSGIKVYVHAPYTLHAFCSPERRAKNYKPLIEHLKVAALLGMDGYILHMGGTKHYVGGVADYYEVIKSFLLEVDPRIPLLLENCASGNSMSGDLAVISSLVDICHAEGFVNVGICLDTLHAWAWGYAPLFDRAYEPNYLEHVKLFHLNSAPDKVKFGGKYDRHSSIRGGYIPLSFFSRLLALHPEMPVILERDSLEGVKSDISVVRKLDRLRENGVIDSNGHVDQLGALFNDKWIELDVPEPNSTASVIEESN